MTTTYTWAQNPQKLRRIVDKMPNASEEAIKAEYIKNGGLTQEVEVVETPKKETTATKVKKAVKKAVKKVTKK